MLRLIRKIFTRKEEPRSEKRKDPHTESQKRNETKTTPTKSTTPTKTKKKSPPKILKKDKTAKASASASATATRKKRLTFSPELRDIVEFSVDASIHNNQELLRVPRCNPPQRPKTYPCRNKYTVFENVDEFNQYARDVSDKIMKQRQSGLPSVSSHYKTMKNRLKETGSYKKKIPPEYRLYDDESGRIVDIRLFSNDDDE